MPKIKIEKSIEIKAEAQAIFDFITNPSNMPALLPGLLETSNLPELPLAAGSQFNYKYRMAEAVLNGVWTVEKIERPSLYKAHTKGISESWWTQTVSPGNGGSIYTLAVEYIIPEGVLSALKAKALAAVNEREADQMLLNLKTIFEKNPA